MDSTCCIIIIIIISLPIIISDHQHFTILSFILVFPLINQSVSLVQQLVSRNNISTRILNFPFYFWTL